MRTGAPDACEHIARTRRAPAAATPPAAAADLRPPLHGGVHERVLPLVVPHSSHVREPRQLLRAEGASLPDRKTYTDARVLILSPPTTESWLLPRGPPGSAQACRWNAEQLGAVSGRRLPVRACLPATALCVVERATSGPCQCRPGHTRHDTPSMLRAA